MISLKETNRTKEEAAVANSLGAAEAQPEEALKPKDPSRQSCPGSRTEAVLFSSSAEEETSAATAWEDALRLKW